MKDNLKQHRTLKNCVMALQKTIIEDYQMNEATLKNNFFHHLRCLNTEHQITVEENLNSHIGFNGRADFYLSDKTTTSYANNVIIEFKIDCFISRKKEIKHDLDKLEKIKTLNSKIAPIFIDFFTQTLDFKEALKIFNLTDSSDSYILLIAPNLKNFKHTINGEILKYNFTSPVILTNTPRFLDQCLIPKDLPTVRIPKKYSKTKYIGLCLEPKQSKYTGVNKYLRYVDFTS